MRAAGKYAGILVRASNIERGVDSYDGHYAGLRTNDQSLVLGRAHHGWQEFRPVPVPGVAPGMWYHLRVVALGCTISASANKLGSTTVASVTVVDINCLETGQVGLRSVGAGGVWRNLHIYRATAKDIPLTSRATEAGHVALFPTSQGNMPPVTVGGRSEDVPLPHVAAENIQSIRNLRLLSASKPEHAIVRGAVILTNPALYIEDANGGTRVETIHPVPLKVGDEVQVEGIVSPQGLNATVIQASAQPIGGLTPIPPLSITADQAATGAYDGMFVEIEGRVRSKYVSAGGATVEFEDGVQAFRTISNSDATASALSKLSKDSVVRLRDLCTVSPEYTKNTVPFGLIVGSTGDIKILIGPLWWSPGHLALLAIAMLGLGFLCHLFYSRAEKWRLQAVISERERLAHEIHDTLAQSFAGIGFQLRAIRNSLIRAGAQVDKHSLLDELGLASDLVRHNHDEARRSIAILRPEALETIGLISALEQSARRMVSRDSVTIKATHNGDARSLPLHVLDSLFRIAQEAFANALQHGHPRCITIQINYQPSSVVLIIRDDGSGFVPGTELGGFGISGMCRRAEAIHATFELASAPGTGTQITVETPIPRVSWLRRLTYTRRTQGEPKVHF